MAEVIELEEPDRYNVLSARVDELYPVLVGVDAENETCYRIVVAVGGMAKDWAAYEGFAVLDFFDGLPDDYILQLVARKGNKLPQSEGRAIFSTIDKRYRP